MGFENEIISIELSIISYMIGVKKKTDPNFGNGLIRCSYDVDTALAKESFEMKPIFTNAWKVHLVELVHP